MSDATHDSHGKDPTKRHRHDIGAVDHGPVTTEAITRGIQGLIGLLVASTLALTIYAVILAAS